MGLVNQTAVEVSTHWNRRAKFWVPLKLYMPFNRNPATLLDLVIV
jgi:hypothetical protein